MSKRECFTGEGTKKGGWSPEEDKKLISYINENGEGGWPDIPQKAGLKRTGKSCRLRWFNYLKPDIKSGGFSYEEEQIIIILHASHGNNWSVIERHLPKRTENEIENYWNTHLKKRLVDKETDTVTHKQLASSPSLAEPKKFDCEEESSTDVQPQLENGFLRCKKRFERSSSTSRLLNQVAARGAAIGKTLSTSLEGGLRSPTSSTCLPSSSSQHIYSKEGVNTGIDLSFPEYDFSQFLDQFISEDDQAGGYNQDLLMPNVPSTKDTLIEDITDWSSYVLDHADLTYEMEQDSNHKNFL